MFDTSFGLYLTVAYHKKMSDTTSFFLKKFESGLNAGFLYVSFVCFN